PEGTLEEAIRRLLQDPKRPVVLDARFVDAEGMPSAGLFALRVAERFLDAAELVPDPGLFPGSVRVAAFRKGGAAAIARWSESGETEISLDLNEGARIQPALSGDRPLRPGERVRVGAMPLFLVNVDPLWIDLRLQLSSPELPLQLAPARLAVTLKNAS